MMRRSAKLFFLYMVRKLEPSQLVDGLNVTFPLGESVPSNATGIIEKSYVFLL